MLGVVVLIDDPHRVLTGDLFVHEDGVHDVCAVGIEADFISIVIIRSVAGVEGNDWQLLAIPVFAVRPIQLQIGLRECVQIVFHIPGAGLGLNLEILGYHIS